MIVTAWMGGRLRRRLLRGPGFSCRLDFRLIPCIALSFPAILRRGGGRFVEDTFFDVSGSFDGLLLAPVPDGTAAFKQLLRFSRGSQWRGIDRGRYIYPRLPLSSLLTSGALRLCLRCLSADQKCEPTQQTERSEGPHEPQPLADQRCLVVWAFALHGFTAYLGGRTNAGWIGCALRSTQAAADFTGFLEAGIAVHYSSCLDNEQAAWPQVRPVFRGQGPCRNDKPPLRRLLDLGKIYGPVFVL